MVIFVTTSLRDLKKNVILFLKVSLKNAGIMKYANNDVFLGSSILL